MFSPNNCVDLVLKEYHTKFKHGIIIRHDTFSNANIQLALFHIQVEKKNFFFNNFTLREALAILVFCPFSF